MNDQFNNPNNGFGQQETENYTQPQPNYNPQQPPYYNGQQQYYNQQPQMYNNMPKKKNRLIPTVISAVVVIALVVAGIFVVPMLLNKTSNTPEEAVQAEIENRMDILKSKEIRKLMADKAKKSIPQNSSANERQTYESIVDETIDVLLNSLDVELKDIKISGDTAVATLKVSMIDYSELGSLLNSITYYTSGDIKKLGKQCDTTTKTKKWDLYIENGKWVADPKDLADFEDLLEDID